MLQGMTACGVMAFLADREQCFLWMETSAHATPELKAGFSFILNVAI
jgi:hypothetical protein